MYPYIAPLKDTWVARRLLSVMGSTLRLDGFAAYAPIQVHYSEGYSVMRKEEDTRVHIRTSVFLS